MASQVELPQDGYFKSNQQQQVSTISYYCRYNNVQVYRFRIMIHSSKNFNTLDEQANKDQRVYIDASLVRNLDELSLFKKITLIES